MSIRDVGGAPLCPEAGGVKKKKRSPRTAVPKAVQEGVERAVRYVFHEGLAPLMEPLGYELAGDEPILRRYGRARPAESVFLLQLLEGKENQAETGSLTLELGVHYPAVSASMVELPAYAYLKSQLAPPQLAVCPLRIRLGELWKGADSWWKIDPDTNLKLLTEQIAVVVLESALPWFLDRQSWRFLLQSGPSMAGLAAWKLAVGTQDEQFKTRLAAFLETERDGAKKSQLRRWGG